ncbi:MAG: Uma2 family endonuclease [Chloroflexaceae bacterium]|nr:Uma2 family endonuclease [Chloroflexaceae bacterium]
MKSSLALRPLVQEVEYPESDGKPMAETDVHRDEMFAVIQALEYFFRNQPDVYVSGNLLLYYQEGDPTRSVAPDVLVVKGIPKHKRRIYRLWVEGRPPNVIIEVTSKSTRAKDLVTNHRRYRLMGVREYLLFDPLGEYLSPQLQGFRLVRGRYGRMHAARDGSLVSQELGMRVLVAGQRLRLVDLASGAPLLRPDEEADAHRAEAAARHAAEQQLHQSEQRAEKLAARLRELGIDPDIL